MITFLTSSFLPYTSMEAPYEVHKAYPDNGFVEMLKEVWPEKCRLLFFTSDPDEHAETDYRAKEIYDVLSASGLSLGEMRIMDHRQTASLPELVDWADCIFLAGGHAPTQLRYMKQCGLKEALRDFDGIVLALSAGSVNAADAAYIPPEREGETEDPLYECFTEGLGLTAVQMIPHRTFMLQLILDGKRYIDEVVMPDSYGRRFYLIEDGSFFRIRDGFTEFFGTGEILEDGCRKPIRTGIIIPVSSAVDARNWATVARDGFDCVMTVDKERAECFYYHIGDRIADTLRDMGCGYEDFLQRFVRAVVEEEQESFLDQLRITCVEEEIKARGNFVRTIHVNTENGRRAKNMRAHFIPGDDRRLLVTLFDITTALDHDWMTDEYARTGFLEQSLHIIAHTPKETALALLYTNVKGFKAVNELFGNQSGDMVIFQTRDALREHLAPLILGRLESDHFVMLVEKDRLTEENLSRLAHQTYQKENKRFHFVIRCGIYEIRDRSVTVEHMIDRAKLAEKSIREEHGGIYARYDEVVRENYVRQRMLLSDMKSAMESDEFKPYYQPVVDAKTGRIVSAEMLIRWQHHDLGLVSPGDFIPIIENEGRISTLDFFMMNHALDFTVRRSGEGKGIVPCAVNLSRIDFYDAFFMDHILGRFARDPALAALVRVEVTESAYADLEKNALDYLNEMKKIGIQILLDDFGSGMSSLATLETFVFDIVKLDMGFIRKIGMSDKAEAIIETTIHLSHALGARVTAEGVETEQQLAFLRKAGCDYIQGYYFFRPMPEAEFVALLDKA